MPRVGSFVVVLLKISTRPPIEIAGLSLPEDSSAWYSRRSQNGIVVHDNIPTAVNTFYQLDYKKVAQSNLYTYDPCLDNNYTNAMRTFDMVSLEFSPTYSGTDTVTAVVEMLDTLGNM